MRVVVIGGTGHIGTYLVPRLVQAGHAVTSVSRGQREPYRPHGAWTAVQRVVLDRVEAEADGTFGARIADLTPDVVIDLTCFTLKSAEHLAGALQGRVQHFLHCGTIWVHGPGVEVPTTEEEPRRPFDDYGREKAAIEAHLLGEARRDGFPATVLHPGHIVGPGWPIVNPQGNFNPEVFETLARGGTLTLPNLGLETVHHVHADDVAQAFMRAMARRSVAVGEAFHVVSPAALTLRGYAQTVYRWFGRQPAIEFLPWEEWKGTVSEADASATWSHIAHSPNCSIAKARDLLGYQPRFSSLEAVHEAIAALVHQAPGD
ncbi:MAG: NAD-dependent epimerase/dehydratase family protein [Candidatus Dormibacteraeota bacterium]|nr:NAD-dependent epimerase/dehydratase family protein [Candidatus Dormibacteraeota bacterium]